jgi:hypothetical protein
MVINKKCYIKSLKKDFSEIGRWAATAAIIIIAAVVGYLLGTSSLNFINEHGVSSATVAMIIELIVLAIMFVLVAMTDRSEAKHGTWKKYTLGVEAGICVATIVITLVYCGYGDIYQIPKTDRIFFLFELVAELVLVTIINVIGTPFMLAYARCNGEPEETPAEPPAETEPRMVKA